MPLNEVEERRRKASEALDEIKLDLERLSAALKRSVRPSALLERFPIAFVGAALGAGFVAGVSRRRRSIATSAAAIAPPASRSVFSQIGGALAAAAMREGLGFVSRHLEGRARAMIETSQGEGRDAERGVDAEQRAAS